MKTKKPKKIVVSTDDITDEQFFTSRKVSSYFEGLATNLLAFISKASKIASRVRIRVHIIFDKDDDMTGCTDGTTIHANACCALVPEDADRDTRMQYLYGIIAHEMGHLFYTDFNLMPRVENALYAGKWPLHPAPEFVGDDAVRESDFWEMQRKNPSVFSQVLSQPITNLMNIIEDGYIEARILKTNRGLSSSCLRLVRAIHWNDFVPAKEMLDKVDDGDASITAVFFQIILEYAKFGSIVLSEDKSELSDDRMKKVLSLLDEIDEALAEPVCEKRLSVVQLIVIRLWDYLREEAQSAFDSQEAFEEMMKALKELIGQSMQGFGGSPLIPQTAADGEQERTNEESREELKEALKNMSSGASGKTNGSDDSGSEEADSADGNGESQEQNGTDSSENKSDGTSDTGDSDKDEKDESGKSGNSGKTKSSSKKSDKSTDSDDTESSGSGNADEKEGNSEDSSEGDNSNGSESGQQGQNSQNESSSSTCSDAEGKCSDNPSQEKRQAGPENILGEKKSSPNPDSYKPDNNREGETGESGSVDVFKSEHEDASRETVRQAITGEIESIMDGLAEEIEEAEETRALTKELQNDAETALNECNANGMHDGVMILVNRIETISDQHVAELEKTEPLVKDAVKKSIREIKKISQDTEIDDVERQLYGGHFSARDFARNDGKRFMKYRDPSEGFDMTVMLLVDESGSMWAQERYIAARTAALAIYEVCIGLDIPIAVYGHSTRSAPKPGYIDCVNLTSYAEAGIVNKHDAERIMEIKADGANRDSVAVRYCADALMKRPEGTKLFILINDGAPSSNHYGGRAAEQELTELARSIKKDGVCFIAAAVGDDKEELERIYGSESYMDVADLSQLPKKLVKQIKNHIRFV